MSAREEFVVFCNIFLKVPVLLMMKGVRPSTALAATKTSITLNIVQLLIDAAPNSVRTVEDNNGWMPIHCLCRNNNVDEIIAIEILKLLVEKCHESVRRASWNGDRPIHYAAMTRSPEFCRVLTFVSWIRTDS
jgi:ankyrin repeat protein